MDMMPGDVATGSRRFVSAEQIEDVVRQLKDVVSTRAVLGPSGRIEELHVLVNPKRAPKQIARDVESALRAHLDVSLDYKKISIAQIQGRAPLGGGGAAGRPRLRFSDVSLTVNGSRAEAVVRLKKDDVIYSGTATGHASGYNQLRLIATATMRAVEDTHDQDGTMVVEDLQTEVPLAGHKAVLVSGQRSCAAQRGRTADRLGPGTAGCLESRRECHVGCRQPARQPGVYGRRIVSLLFRKKIPVKITLTME